MSIIEFGICFMFMMFTRKLEFLIEIMDKLREDTWFTKFFTLLKLVYRYVFFAITHGVFFQNCCAKKKEQEADTHSCTAFRCQRSPCSPSAIVFYCITLTMANRGSKIKFLIKYSFWIPVGKLV